MPSPAGPSRMMVYGTTSQPVAADTRYAPSSRPASVPSGKSHSGASPATGFYTQWTLKSSRCASQRNVALLADRIRPMTVSSPRRNASPSLGVGFIVGLEQAPPVAIGTHADMALRVEGLVAERTWRTAGRDDPVGSRRELTGRLGGEEHAHRIGTV